MTFAGVPDESTASPSNPTEYVCDIPTARLVASLKEYKSPYREPNLIRVERFSGY